MTHSSNDPAINLIVIQDQELRVKLLIQVNYNHEFYKVSFPIIRAQDLSIY